MANETLQTLYIDELRDLYSAEQQLVKALPKLVKNAETEELSDAIANHLEETKNHVTRLEQIFEKLDESPKGKKCVGMEGLIKEGAEVMDEFEGKVLDAGLISAAQRVEHYEIASYGSLQSWAELLEENEAADLLQETLDEEKATDEKLTQTAENAINVEDEQEGGQEEEAERASSSRGRSR